MRLRQLPGAQWCQCSVPCAIHGARGATRTLDDMVCFASDKAAGVFLECRPAIASHRGRRPVRMSGGRSPASRLRIHRHQPLTPRQYSRLGSASSSPLPTPAAAVENGMVNMWSSLLMGRSPPSGLTVESWIEHHGTSTWGPIDPLAPRGHRLPCSQFSLSSDTDSVTLANRRVLTH